MGEHEFLKLLARVIRLNKDIRIHTTRFAKFAYEVTEANGTLFLTVQFPNEANKVTISYDTKRYDDFMEKLDSAEAYLEEKSNLTSRYF